MTASNESGKAMSYVAKHDCGKLVMAAVDVPEHKDDTAREVAACLRKGFTIERMTVAEVRAADWCDCKVKTYRPKESTAGQLALL